MGDRSQIRFIDDEHNEVWFYSHWDGSDIEHSVKKSMSRGREIYNDPEYFARIIFCDLVEGSEKSLTGYGIGFGQHGDVYRVITVDCSNSMVTFLDGSEVPFTDF